MRHRLIRHLVSDIFKASKLEKIVLIIPFIVLIVDTEIFYYAWIKDEKTILIAAAFVLFLSVLEIVSMRRIYLDFRNPVIFIHVL